MFRIIHSTSPQKYGEILPRDLNVPFADAAAEPDMQPVSDTSIGCATLSCHASTRSRALSTIPEETTSTRGIRKPRTPSIPPPTTGNRRQREQHSDASSSSFEKPPAQCRRGYTNMRQRLARRSKPFAPPPPRLSAPQLAPVMANIAPTLASGSTLCRRSPVRRLLRPTGQAVQASSATPASLTALSTTRQRTYLF